MSALPSPVAQSRLRQAWQVISDLLLVTALLWTLPLLLGAASALVNLVSGSR